MNDRRPVRSQYNREARTTRRPRDNKRKIKKQKKGGKQMLSDKQLLVIGLIVGGAWISLIAFVFAWVYFTWTTLP